MMAYLCLALTAIYLHRRHARIRLQSEMHTRASPSVPHTAFRPTDIRHYTHSPSAPRSIRPTRVSPASR